MEPKKYIAGILLAMAAILPVGCGSSYNGSTGTTGTTGAPVTNVKKRVLLSTITTTGGGIFILDAQKNNFASISAAGLPIPIGVNQPSKILTASGQTVFLNSTTAQLTVFSNSTEQLTATTSMQGQPFDVAISPDGQTAYAAIRETGVVEVVNTTSGNLVATMTVPGVNRLVEGTGGHKMLAFAENPQALLAPNTNGFFVIDTGTNTVTAITGPGLDQPFTAVFDPTDANDTTAFILNCGAECGGATASVIKVNFGGATPTFSAPIPVSAATVALLNGANLFVAGTPTTAPAGCTLAACGTLQVINTGSLTAGAPINITDGSHGVMALTSNNKLYIGAARCSVGPVSAQNTVQGCLSIFDTGAGPSAFNPVVPVETSFRQNFDVTGIQPISSENTVYVVQGGELDIFDINTSQPSTIIQQLDVNGRAMDALQIDP